MKHKKTKKSHKINVFTGTEVGALIKDFKGDLQLVAEQTGLIADKVNNLDKKVDQLAEDMIEVRADIGLIKDDLKRRVRI